MNSLPAEVIVRMGLACDLRDVSRLAQTCKSLCQILSGQDFWCQRYAQDYGVITRRVDCWLLAYQMTCGMYVCMC